MGGLWAVRRNDRTAPMSVEDAAAPALSAPSLVARTAAPLRQAAAPSAAEQKRAALLTAPIIAGGVFTLSVSVGGPHLYRALGGAAGALDAATTYSNYLFAGAIPVWIVNLQAAALRGSGNVRVPALVTLVGAIVTIPVSPA